MKKYEAYKNSGVEWIGETPEGWEILKMNFILSGLQDGTHGTYERIDSGYPLLSAKNVLSSGIILEEKESYISESDFNAIVSNGFPQKGDVALCCVGTVGRCCIYTYDYPMAFQRSVTFLRPNNKVKSKYLWYYLQSNIFQDQLGKYAKTSAQSGVYLGDIAKTIAILPSLLEQQAIASYLDHKVGQIDASISAIDQQIEDLKAYRMSIISETVTKGLDPNARMKDSGIEWIGEVPENWKPMRFKHFVDQITTPSTHPHKIALENIESKTGKFVTTDSEFEGNGIAFNVDDIVYGKLRPYLQKVWKAEFEGNAVGDFFVYRVKDNCISSYLKYVMLSDNFTSAANGSTYGAKMPRVAAEFISNAVWFLPSLSEQQPITDYLDDKTSKIDAAITTLEQQREDLMSLKQSVISEAVTGKIDVRGWKSNNEQ